MTTHTLSHRYAKMPPVPISQRSWPDTEITTAPVFCAVDMRDGNQALPDPMNPEQKKAYFELLCRIGFKQIEVGFPSASADDFQVCRDIVEQNLGADDVTMSVLTPARPELIERTFEAVKGGRNVLIHFYIASSELHRGFVFGLSEEDVLQRVTACAKLIRERMDAAPETNWQLQFSPEEFTDTDLDYAVRLCDAVVAAWDPRPEQKVILNLPATVERRMPNEYADMIEAFIRRQAEPERTLVSLHAHNDMGMAIAATMLGLQAGAHRVEGTLFGHGERTGNVDLMTVALNLEYLGVSTGLDFSDLPDICEQVEKLTGMPVHARHPYAGDLVFTAFSGSHQDAIHKGLSRIDELREAFGGWKVPYLHIDPRDIGRRFDRFIRITSQSGKGGMAHIMETVHHVRMPRWVQIDFARYVQDYVDQQGGEVSADHLWRIFTEAYCQTGPLELEAYWPWPSEESPGEINGEAQLTYRGEPYRLKDTGNGPISAFVHALKQLDDLPAFRLEDYDEETRGKSADAEAICFTRIVREDTEAAHIGVGFDSNINQAAVRAIVSGLNALLNA